MPSFHAPLLDVDGALKSAPTLIALGSDISEGNGSRVRIKLNGERAVFHGPHPQKETDKGSVMSMRRFLENAGVSK